MNRWLGEPLGGRTLLVWTDQGLGDTLMMLRYLPLIEGRVVVSCEAPLARLVESMGYRVHLKGSGTITGDVHCPMMSLPYVFGTTPETIPSEVYIKVPRNPRFEMPTDRLRVALCWAGMKNFFRDHLRSLHFSQLKPITDLDCYFMSAQKGVAQEQANDYAMVDFMDECADFYDTAQLLNEIDLLITVDTGIAHLAGAMGIRLWLLDRYESEWRWSAPWYRTMRIFRQRRFSEWAPVITEVSLELKGMIDAFSSERAKRVRPGLLAGLGSEAGHRPDTEVAAVCATVVA